MTPRPHHLRQLLNPRYWLVLEAVLYIWLARLAIRWLPFRWLTWWFTRPVRSSAVRGEVRQQTIRDVNWAFRFAKNRLGVDFVCLSGCMASQTLLRRRGIGTTLYYGAATHPEKGGLQAHVWLQDGDVGVSFHENAAAYYVLASYSPGGMMLNEHDNRLGK